MELLSANNVDGLGAAVRDESPGNVSINASPRILDLS
jgi:hypothetical protein